MKRVTVNELVDFKILPFDVFDENGDIIVNAGDNLTPGKLLQLRYVSKLYCNDEVTALGEDNNSNDSNTSSENNNQDGENSQSLDIDDNISDNAINVTSSIGGQAQLKLKSIFKKAYSALNTKVDAENIKQIKLARDKILDNLLPIISKTYKKSQLKILGNYEKYHGLNVAILTIMLAKKMGLSDSQLADVTLAALLHDIGKSRLPKEFHTSYSSNTASQSNMMYELHPELGYKILKNEMRLPEIICVVALEHHEKNDGSGYPYGVSSDLIHNYSQMVAICNMYDNIISGQTTLSVSSPQEAVKRILELGTSWFVPEVLFSFVNMTSYHDDISLEELGSTGSSHWE